MPRPFMDTSPGRLEQAFHFNVSTAHALLRPAVPLMLEGGGGSVVNISSAMGRMAGRGYVAYGTAKGALTHYTRLAAADLSPRIRVNAIAVGSVATSALDIVMQTDELRQALEDGTPLKRIGDPEDIAATVVYLASEAGFVHHREDPRGRRGHREPQPRHGPPRHHHVSLVAPHRTRPGVRSTPDPSPSHHRHHVPPENHQVPPGPRPESPMNHP